MYSQPAHFQCRAREAGEATTYTLSEGHRLGATRRSSGGSSARTSPIFPSFH